VWHLRHFPFAEALDRMREGILAYNFSKGITEGYHDTVTVVYVHLVADACKRLDRGQGLGALANAVIEHLGVKPEQRKALFNQYYSEPEALLKTDEARAAFIPPDLKPLPT
ncbi:MAG: hypothetical protein IT462_00220, partial [Planctomycetes bacterium]|nr:hypothetical protein [Planctomycetota bacterium]